MISLREALATALPSFTPRAVERVSLERAGGRFLAADLDAREDVPGLDESAMDGWAVRAADVRAARPDQPISLRVEGESRAGGPLPPPHRPGGAMRIFTGAPMPDGADAVVMQEDSAWSGDVVEIRFASERGRHVRVRAEVIARGARLLSTGTALEAGAIGALASQGYAYAPVYARPRVAILSTGDELREIGAPAVEGTRVDSNAYALAAAVREAGGVPLLLPLGADDRAALTARVREGLRADVLVSTGGVSVGDYDLVHEAFEDCGVKTLFHKVRLKPGKPIRFGTAGDVPVVGLPGNPVSALVTFELFVRPGLRRMLGDPRPFRPSVDVTLGWDARAPDTRTELARVRLERRDGALVATPHHAQGSATLTSMIGVDALAILPQGGGEMPAGSLARAIDLRSHGHAHSAFE